MAELRPATVIEEGRLNHSASPPLSQDELNAELYMEVEGASYFVIDDDEVTEIVKHLDNHRECGV